MEAKSLPREARKEEGGLGGGLAAFPVNLWTPPWERMVFSSLLNFPSAILEQVPARPPCQGHVFVCHLFRKALILNPSQ